MAIMALHRLSFRLRQTVSHVRTLHTTGCGQQQEAVAVESEPEPLSVFRTQEIDPACHSENHIGQYYTVRPTHVRPLFSQGLPWRYQQQMKTFNEACIMVRQPALEVISYLKKTDYSKPIKTKQRYMWTKREFTEEGSTLGQLVDQGISRVKSSSDVVGALMKELRLQSGQPESNFRLAVAVDGVNALWGRSTIKKENKSAVDPEELTLVYNLRKMMKNDWSGGAIITTLSQTGSLYTSKSAYLPQELLGERGFDNMDPFVPVSVSNYSEKEFESCYLYYMDRQWLQHPQSRTEDGKKELIFLSNRNPTMLERICAFL
ncbi:hypothetical protein INR49_032139 [Caranx melampygus]|nr:hypothetical protein INR49_032139 [Caranx melampygus]